MRRLLYVGLLAALLSGQEASAGASDDIVRIGFLSDLNGPSAVDDGEGSIDGARMAIEDIGGKVLGKPVELVVADHQHKPEIGLSLALHWLDVDHVSAIMDVNNSAIALGVQKLVRDHNKIFLITGAASSDLTGKACSPNSVHWLNDTYALSHAAVRAVDSEGDKSWYFLTVDYAFGHGLEQEAFAQVKADSGQVMGQVHHPIGTHDFSSFLLQAQASGAKNLALANSAQDTEATIKQAREFGLQQRIVPLMLFLADIHALGQDIMAGVQFVDNFYWDMDDKTRAWSKRFFERNHFMPGNMNANAYSAVAHYLQAIKAAGTIDATEVMKQMKANPIRDALGDGGYVRADGRVIRDLYLFEVKSTKESKYPWDYYKLVRRIPADNAYRPIAEGGCPFITATQK